MATRTSISSPWRLRVADASAASIASKIISLSTPFSLETASTTIRISLLIPVVSPPSPIWWLKLGNQPRLVDVGDAQPIEFAVHTHRHVTLFHAFQRAAEPPPAFQRGSQRDLRLAADETLEVLGTLQRPVQTGRGHLQHVLAGDRVLHVQYAAHLVAPPLAILEVHAFGLVDIEPQQSLASADAGLQVHELVAHGRQRRLQQLPDLFLCHSSSVTGPVGDPNKKWAPGPISFLLVPRPADPGSGRPFRANKKPRAGLFVTKNRGSGGRIRTCDLRVMSPTSCQTAPPRIRRTRIVLEKTWWFQPSRQ